MLNRKLKPKLRCFTVVADVETQVRAAFQPAEPVSNGYGIVEKITDITVFSGNFGWDDVGSWPALERSFPRTTMGMWGPVASLHQCDSCIVHWGDKLVAVIGANNLIVVETDDVVLICRKERAQEVKRVLAALQESGEAKSIFEKDFQQSR